MATTMDMEVQNLDIRSINSIPTKPVSTESERQPQQDGNDSEQILAAQTGGGLPDRTDALGSDSRPNTKKSDAQAPGSDQSDADQFEYITGTKLALATGVISLTTFTMLLDTAIIVTVSRPNIAAFLSG